MTLIISLFTLNFDLRVNLKSFLLISGSFNHTLARSSLRTLGTVGEPINPKAWQWYQDVVGEGRCPIVDTWWQTETGKGYGAAGPQTAGKLSLRNISTLPNTSLFDSPAPFKNPSGLQGV